MSVPIAVVAHPQRTEMASVLAEHVGAQCVSWDNAYLRCEGNHQQAWQYLINCPEPWVCVLEDDAQPCEHFHKQLLQVLLHAPDPIVSLYLGRGRPDQWQLPISSVIGMEACFIRSDTLLSTVGYAVRTELLADMLRTVPSVVALARVELPEAISRWSQCRGHRISYTRPSIVQHLDVGTVTPTEDRYDGQKRTEVRKAWLFDWRDRWTSSYVDLPSPDVRRADKVAPHLRVVREASL